MLQYIHQNTTISHVRIRLQLKGVHDFMHYSFIIYLFRSLVILQLTSHFFCKSENLTRCRLSLCVSVQAEQRAGAALVPGLPRGALRPRSSAEDGDPAPPSALPPCWKVPVDLPKRVGYMRSNGVSERVRTDPHASCFSTCGYSYKK